MKEITFASLRPLISHSQEQNRAIHVTFQCPVTGTAVNSSATIRVNPTMTGNIKNSVQNSVMYQIRASVYRALRSAFGGGVTGRIAADVAHGAIPHHNTNRAQQAPSEADRQSAVVEAFQRVASQFHWDADNQRWVSAEASSGSGAPDVLAAQLARGPLAQRYDKSVMARMIIEIAKADGKLANEEREFLTEFLPPELGTLDELAARPALSHIELDETTEGATRETLLLLSWTIALTDEELDQAENQLLSQFAVGLSINSNRAAELRAQAQEFIFTKALERASYFGYDPNAVQEAMGAARRIGMAREQAQRAEIRFRKARGLF